MLDVTVFLFSICLSASASSRVVCAVHGGGGLFLCTRTGVVRNPYSLFTRCPNFVPTSSIAVPKKESKRGGLLNKTHMWPIGVDNYLIPDIPLIPSSQGTAAVPFLLG